LKKTIGIDPDVMKRLGGLPKHERSECLQALCDLFEAFGRPHIHSGIGIRKLRDHIFECRGNRDLRFVFVNRPDSLYMLMLGNHSEVQHFLRHLK
jgi:hypothetical protein